MLTVCQDVKSKVGAFGVDLRHKGKQLVLEQHRLTASYSNDGILWSQYAGQHECGEHV